jgi:DNA polymerase zeta
MPEFLVRVASIDYYMAQPRQPFDTCVSAITGEALARVPIVRVFGATPDGQRCCLHIHQAFPYCYVPCTDDMPDPTARPEETQKLLARLAREIDAAIAPTAPSAADGEGKADSWQRKARGSVVSVTVVQGLPFYGYTPTPKLFLKIELCHPSSVGRVAALLHSGAVLDRPLQPFEAHVPFVLQFMIGQNIAGMDLLRTRAEHHRPLASRLAAAGQPGGDSGSGVTFRPPLPAAEGCSGAWNIGGSWSVAHGERRQTRCEIEADVSVTDVLNRHEIGPSDFKDASLAERLVSTLASIYKKDDASQAPEAPVGHILSTQPGSQPRVPVPPTGDEELMQANVRGMVEADGSQPENSTQSSLVLSPVGQGTSQASSPPAESTQYAWAPFIDALMNRSQQTQGTVAAPSAFSEAENAAQSQPLLDTPLELTARQSDAGSESFSQMADILDWMRDGTELEGASSPSLGGNGEDDGSEDVEEDGEEECNAIMTSQAEWARQTQPDITDGADAEAEGTIPQLDGSSDSPDAQPDPSRRRRQRRSAGRSAVTADTGTGNAADAAETARTKRRQRSSRDPRRPKRRKPAVTTRQGLGQFLAVTAQGSPTRARVTAQTRTEFPGECCAPPRFSKGDVLAVRAPAGDGEFWLCRVEVAAPVEASRVTVTWLELNGLPDGVYSVGDAHAEEVECEEVVSIVRANMAADVDTLSLTAEEKSCIAHEMDSANDDDAEVRVPPIAISAARSDKEFDKAAADFEKATQDFAKATLPAKAPTPQLNARKRSCRADAVREGAAAMPAGPGPTVAKATRRRSSAAAAVPAGTFELHNDGEVEVWFDDGVEKGWFRATVSRVVETGVHITYQVDRTKEFIKRGDLTARLRQLNNDGDDAGTSVTHGVFAAVVEELGDSEESASGVDTLERISPAAEHAQSSLPTYSASPSPPVAVAPADAARPRFITPGKLRASFESLAASTERRTMSGTQRARFQRRAEPSGSKVVHAAQEHRQKLSASPDPKDKPTLAADDENDMGVEASENFVVPESQSGSNPLRQASITDENDGVGVNDSVQESAGFVHDDPLQLHSQGSSVPPTPSPETHSGLLKSPAKCPSAVASGASHDSPLRSQSPLSVPRTPSASQSSMGSPFSPVHESVAAFDLDRYSDEAFDSDENDPLVRETQPDHVEHQHTSPFEYEDAVVVQDSQSPSGKIFGAVQQDQHPQTNEEEASSSAGDASLGSVFSELSSFNPSSSNDGSSQLMSQGSIPDDKETSPHIDENADGSRTRFGESPATAATSAAAGPHNRHDFDTAGRAAEFVSTPTSLPSQNEGADEWWPGQVAADSPRLSYDQLQHGRARQEGKVYVVTPRQKPPTAADLADIEIIHKEPFYSDPADKPVRPFVFAGITHRIPTGATRDLEPFQSSLASSGSLATPAKRTAYVLIPARLPPSAASLLRLLKKSSDSVKTNVAVKTAITNGGLMELESSAPRESQSQSQSLTQSVSADDESQDHIRVLSPRYDEGIGFSVDQHGTGLGGSLQPVTGAVATPDAAKSPGRRIDSSLASSDQSTSNQSKAAASPNSTASSSAGSLAEPSARRRSLDISQISGPTPASEPSTSQTGFQSVSAVHGVQHLVSCSMELHARSRSTLRPDPRYDPVLAVVYCVRDETLQQRQQRAGGPYTDAIGCVAVAEDADGLRSWSPGSHWAVEAVASETELMLAFVRTLLAHDPDFLIGYEVRQTCLTTSLRNCAHSLRNQPECLARTLLIRPAGCIRWRTARSAT